MLFKENVNYIFQMTSYTRPVIVMAGTGDKVIGVGYRASPNDAISTALAIV